MKMDKKHSRGITLVFAALVMGLLAGSVSAAIIKEEINVGPENPAISKFTVNEIGTIYAEVRLEVWDTAYPPCLILEFLSTGEIKERVCGKSDELLTLRYNVSDKDIDRGGEWKISVESIESNASGNIKITYPSDTNPPTVIESTPTGENVPVTTQITVTFSEPMNKKSVESASSYIYPEVSGELYWEDNTIIFTPSSNLNYDTRYVVGIKGGDRGAMDLAGNVMEESYEWNFETVSPELLPPTAIISATPREINEGESVSFSAEASSDQDGYIVSYYWDFGEGDNDTGINVEHTYSHSGHYTATLTVTDNDVLSTRDRVEITVNTLITPNIPPTAYIDIYPNPAGEGERVTFEGYGEDEDGEVVECRWTVPDGTTFSDFGSSSSVTLEPEDVHTGWYSFAVRDDEEAWSEEVGIELELETPPDIPWIWLLPAIVLVIAAALIIRNRIDEDKKKRGKGSIDADSNPQNALIFLDEGYRGLSRATVPEVPVGAHLVKFRKFGYFDCEREAMVNANQTTHVHCDLTKIPEIKLKLSAEPTEIPADGKSESTITIRIEDNNEIPIPVPEDVTVELKTNAGTVESPVKIPAGPALVTTTLTSSKAEGTATVEAKALFLKGSTTVEFLQSA